MHKIYILIILILLVSSCKRWQHEYPEDGQRSKLTPRERLLGKTWVLTQLTLNGQDYMDTIRERFGNFKMKLYDTKYNPTDETDNARYGAIFPTKTPAKTIIWMLYNNDENFSAGPLFAENDDFILQGYINHKHLGTILKLTDNQFKLKTQYTDMDSIVISTFIPQ
jgi:hypothetical protein